MIACEYEDPLMASMKFGLRAWTNDGRTLVLETSDGTRITGPETGINFEIRNNKYLIKYNNKIIEEANACIAILRAYNLASDSLRGKHDLVITRITGALKNYRPSKKCIEWMKTLHNIDDNEALIYCKVSPLLARLYEIVLETSQGKEAIEEPDIYYGMKRLEDQRSMLENLRRAIPGKAEILHLRLLHSVLASFIESNIWRILAITYHAGFNLLPGRIYSDDAILSVLMASELSWALGIVYEIPNKPIPKILKYVAIPLRFTPVQNGSIAKALYINRLENSRCIYPCLVLSKRCLDSIYSAHSTNEELGGFVYESEEGPLASLICKSNNINKIIIKKCDGSHDSLENALTAEVHSKTFTELSDEIARG